jgi:membrane-associated phospholipid phosphatase
MTHLSTITNLLRRNIVFCTLSLILVAVLGLALLYIPKGELHLLLCDRHTPARDIFYRYYTQIAEWFPYAVCVLILLFGRIGDGAMASASMAVSGLATQGFKYLADTDRPLTWFAHNMPDITLPLVEGVRMSKFYSFPSGHTTSFFALAFVVCILATRILSEKRSYCLSALLQTALFALAALGGYSRIYLSQHFPEDIAGGVIVGLLITLLCYVVFYRFKDQKWYNYRIFAKK